MERINRYIYSAVLALAGTALFSCSGNYSNIQKLNIKDNAPIGIGKNVNLKYTDSGAVAVNLITARYLNFGNMAFPYTEFPEGVEVHFWDDGKESVITSDYAIQYDGTALVDLRKNVHLITHDSTELRAEQLYWDQKNKWVFTDEPYQIKFDDGSYNDG
ncbi:MAG: LPS export ABC transporter periplasmic protein LptC, partial [Marinirhabdus sp.]